MEIALDSILSVLKRVSVLNRDNGLSFTNTNRLDVIAGMLSGSKYHRMEADGLFHMYGLKPVNEIKGPVLIVSSHVDCERHITRCFCEQSDPDILLGTFDNSITNAAILYLMLSGSLPDHVLIAFTGDEEETGKGCKDVIRFIKKNKLDVQNIFVLDVTEEGWNNNADFTIENDFWDEEFEKRIVELVKKTGYRWNYVPGELDEIPDFIPKEFIIKTEAYEDESWEYDEEELPCFSFCLPTKGEMHCDEGILARVTSFQRYTEVLGRMLV